MKTPHTKESHALHIRDRDDTVLVYTSDTAFDETLATLGRSADLLILECTYFKDKPAKKHLELAEAMFLVRKAKPKRAMLTHFYPEWDQVDFKAEVSKFSPDCEMIEAVDGLAVEF
jgi:ribonuclease BN (tRNA processing enzyme)